MKSLLLLAFHWTVSLAVFGQAQSPITPPLLAAAGAPPADRQGDGIPRKSADWWAFLPLAKPAPPQVRALPWIRTPIDRFILSKLESKNLTPNPIADRRTLIRRASLDLIGLPPAPEEVAAFESDPDPDAYDKLLDRLLSSPHYGERWGRHWLDLARFGESHGFEQDYDRPHAYHYRDFVIRALNDDLPYDTFVRWQLAGDEFEPNNPLALMATGFIGAGVFPTQITANEVEKSRYDALDDMASTAGTALLGLTVGCARCHDHKFDPISTQEYYRFISAFTTTVRSNVELDLEPEKHREALDAWTAAHRPLVDDFDRFEKEQMPSRFENWLSAKPRPALPDWLILELKKTEAKSGAKFTLQPDGSHLASGPKAKQDIYTFEAELPSCQITGLRLEALADPSLPKSGPGRAGNGNFALSDLELTMLAPGADSEPQPLRLRNAAATFEQAKLPVAAAIDGDPKSAWAVDPEFGKNHAAMFELETPARLSPGARLRVRLKFENNDEHAIGRVRLAIATGSGPLRLGGDHAPQYLLDVLRLLNAAPETWAAGERALVARWFAAQDPDWLAKRARVQQSESQKPKPKLTPVMIASEGVTPIRHHTQGADFFNETHFLRRGDVDQKGEVVSQGFLQALMKPGIPERHWKSPPPSGARTSFRRAALANWITDMDAGAGPLLARVIANRLWHYHFGRGIVATPSDFGAQGERPSHPELLDWLAQELIRNGWRLKPMHKLIMSSAVYLQSTAPNPAQTKLDPDNRLLGRREMRRLEAEIIRDAMLHVSGALNLAMFGPGSLDEGHRRRSIYFTVKRSQLVSTMQLFDAPSGILGLDKRATTTIAPQALMFLNNAQVRAYASEFATRLDANPNSPWPAVVDQAYRKSFGRAPRPEETASAIAFLSEQTNGYGAEGVQNPRQVALADFCQALLSLNEFVYAP